VSGMFMCERRGRGPAMGITDGVEIRKDPPACGNQQEQGLADTERNV
jgi:hypothetical protein